MKDRELEKADLVELLQPGAVVRIRRLDDRRVMAKVVDICYNTGHKRRAVTSVDVEWFECGDPVPKHVYNVPVGDITHVLVGVGV